MRFLLSLLIGSAFACGTSPKALVKGSVDIQGTAYVFSMHGGELPNAQVSILELPDRQTTADGDGRFQFTGLPADSDLTFLVRSPLVKETLTSTFRTSASLTNVTFQAPDPDTYALLVNLTGITPREDRCQIATTVTRVGLMGNDVGGNGEPDATVTISPAIPSDASGPIYFYRVSDNFIYPDPALTGTTGDGGVLFLNVPPGEYTLEAHKPGTTFLSARIKCRAGLVTNASPPWGLPAQSGGIGPRPDARP